MKRLETLYGNERSKEAVAFLEAVAEVSRQHGFVFWIETQDCVVVTRSIPHDPTNRWNDVAPTVEAQCRIPELIEVDD